MGLLKMPKREMERCFQLLHQIERGEDPRAVLKDLEPIILQLRHGKIVFSQIEKLVLAGNPKRAVQLLQAVPHVRASSFRYLSVFSPVLGFAVFGLFSSLLPRCDSAYDLAFTSINSCPRAVELLGPNIHQVAIGYSCGSSETSGGLGHASWSLRVSGEKASGTYRYIGRNEGRGWHLVNAELDTAGRTVSIQPCGTSAVEP